LLVLKDPALASAITRGIEEAWRRATVVTRNTARAGLETFKERRGDHVRAIAVVVVNANMPLESGADLCRELMKIDFPPQRVIGVTGGGRGLEHVQDMLDLGTLILRMPFNIDELIEAIEAADRGQ